MYYSLLSIKGDKVLTVAITSIAKPEMHCQLSSGGKFRGP